MKLDAFCQHCGYAVSSEHIFCARCGEPLHAGAAAPAAPVASRTLVGEQVGKWLGYGNATVTFATATLGVLLDFLAPVGPWLGLFALVLVLLWLGSTLVRLLPGSMATSFGKFPAWVAGTGTPVWSNGRFWWSGAVVAGICAFAFASSQARAQGGVVAARSNTLQGWQQTLGLLQQQQAEVKAELQLGNLLQQEGNANTRDIERNTALGKKEASEDPRKELANMGVPWDVKKYNEALRTGDKRTARLFILGDMPPDRITLRFMLFDADSDIGDVFRRYSTRAPLEDCVEVAPLIGWNFHNNVLLLPTQEAIGRWHRACRGEALRAELQKSIDRLEKTAAKERETIPENVAEFKRTQVFFSDVGRCIQTEEAFWLADWDGRKMELVWGSVNRVGLHYAEFKREWFDSDSRKNFAPFKAAVAAYCKAEHEYYSRGAPAKHPELVKVEQLLERWKVLQRDTKD